MDGGVNFTLYADGNAVVRVQDGMTVTSAPTFTSDASATLAENNAPGATVFDADAPDADGDTVTYSLSGTDAQFFTIDTATGVVTANAAFDFEAPADLGTGASTAGDNVYDLVVTASDGTNTTDQAVSVTVTDLLEVLNLSALDGTNGFTLNGIDASDFSGRSVSSAGDVNGDGFDDLIVGAFGADPNGNGGFRRELRGVWRGKRARHERCAQPVRAGRHQRLPVERGRWG